MNALFGIGAVYIIITVLLFLLFRDIVHKNKALKIFIALWPLLCIIGLYMCIAGDAEYDPYPEQRGRYEKRKI